MHDNSSEDFSRDEALAARRLTSKTRKKAHQLPRSKAVNPPPEYRSVHYDPLPKNRRAIRLLNLFSSSSDTTNIICELLTPSDDPKNDGPARIPYEALSWCWGTSEKTSYISIRKGQKTYAKYISPDLFSALRALRHHQKDRCLWIDAICIDQENLNEKNHQVEMMDLIYGDAERVCVWLGDPTTSSRIALRFIQEEVLQLRNFDELCESAEASSKWRALLELMQRPWFSRRWVVQEIALARRAVIYCGPDKISWNKFAIAVELFVEVETATHRLSEVMKKDPMFYHVPGWFEYVSALGASLLVDATGRLFRDYKDEQSSDSSLPDETPDLASSSDSDSNSDIESDTSSVFETPNVGDAMSLTNGAVIATQKKGRGQPLLGLEYLVSSLSIFDTSVPHDTIYGLLAIAKDTTPTAAGPAVQGSSDHAQYVLEIFTQRKRYNVDYNLPYVDVCKDFIQFCIERSLQIDRSRALDVICRPWATEEKVLEARRRAIEKEKLKQEKRRRNREKRGRKRMPKKPQDSKFPDIESRYENLSEEAIDEKLLDIKIRNAARDSTQPNPNDARKSKDMPLPSWVPQLSGAPYAMYPQAGIAGIKMSRKNADPLVGLPSATQKNYTAAETKAVDMKTLKFRKRDELGHYSMYVRGFVLDTIAEVSQLSRNGQIPQEWTELGGWPDAYGNPPDEFWRTLVADRGKDEKNPPVYYSRACKESFEKGGYVGGAVNTSDLINYERNSVVAQFCRRVQAVIWNRALVKTKSGRLGLVGRNVQKGDLVCILYGCSVPVILRQSSSKDNDTFDAEMEWELNFLKHVLGTCYSQYRDRVKKHQERKANAKEIYSAWELKLSKQWLRDQEWRRKWQRKLAKEKADESQTGHTVKRQYDVGDISGLATTKQAYRQHLSHLIWNTDLRLGREFNAWKKEKRGLAEKDKRADFKPPVVNWREFELRLKYGRFWRKVIKEEKERLRKEIEASWKNRRIQRRNAALRKAELSAHGSAQSQNSLTKVSSPQSPEFVGVETPGSPDPRVEAAKKGKAPLPPSKKQVNGYNGIKVPRKLSPMEIKKAKATLCEDCAKEYNLKIRENFRERVEKEGGRFHYLLLGECYVHAMMDGEAMAYQNENGIKTTAFELR